MDRAAQAPWERLYHSDNFQRDFVQIFDGTFRRAIARTAGDRADADDLYRGVETGVRAYLKARRIMTLRKPGKLETDKLERVADAAHRLHMALSAIESTRNPQIKLAYHIERAVDGVEGRGADLLTLARQRHGPSDPLGALREISGLLADAAAESVGKKPGDPSDDKKARGAEIWGFELEKWGTRRRFTKTYPIRPLVSAFRPTWERNSEHPYTVGMHHKSEGKTDSPAVDAVHLIVRRLDPRVARKTVATAFRPQESKA